VRGRRAVKSKELNENRQHPPFWIKLFLSVKNMEPGLMSSGCFWGGAGGQETCTLCLCTFRSLNQGHMLIKKKVTGGTLPFFFFPALITKAHHGDTNHFPDAPTHTLD
jgi:hypothetical protein